MKQKIKNSCFSKMKRVALALFAALCVGSAMAGDRGVFWSRPPEINVSPNGLIIINKGTANNYTWSKDDSGHDQTTYNAAVNGLTCEDRLEYTLVTTEGETITREIIVKEAYSVTNVGWHGPTLDSDYSHQIEEWGSHQVISVSVTYKAILNKSVSSTIDYKNKQNRDKFIYSGYNFEMTGVLSTSATWDNSKSCFVVSGNAIADKVRVKYVLGDLDLAADSVLNESKEVDVVDNEYRVEIPYTSEVKLLWSVYNVDGESESVYEDLSGKRVFEQFKLDNARVVYSWTGDSKTGLWADVGNWGPNVTSSTIGYPGTKGVAWYFTRCKFDMSTDENGIDLNGGEYGFVDDGAFEFAENITVKFKNGTICAASGHLGFWGDSFGAVGTTIIFENVNLRSFNGQDFNTKGYCDVTPRSGTTLVFEGNISTTAVMPNSSNQWRYRPMDVYSDTKFVFKNGQIHCGYAVDVGYKPSIHNTHEVLIDNAVWQINTSNGADRGLANTLAFKDGDTRQARLIIHDGSDNNGETPLLLPEKVEIKIPAQPYTNPYIDASALIGTPNSTFRIDATDFTGAGSVKLLELDAADTYIPTLEVVVDGKVINNASRNARLVWEDRTLCYQQSATAVVASINEATYETLEAAIDAAGEGDTVKLVADIAADTAIVVTKAVTIDLNGKKIKANDTDAETDGNGVFWVKQGGVLTIEGEGTVDGNGGNGYKMAVWADSGKVVINGGTYVNLTDGTHPQYDLIYVKNGGIVEINGGTFKCQTPRWTLNSNNKSPGTFVVKGGKFYQYNPTDFYTDEADDVTNWCADGYTVVEGKDADAGYYIVVENPAIAPDGLTEVAADSPEAAAAKVAIKVPDAMKDVVSADKYAEYFVKSAEYNETTGKYTVTAALNPDVVKPVIAETTADDTTKEAFVIDAKGNVTLNINNKKPGLYYGVQVLAELGADPEVTVSGLVLPAEKIPEGNATFFRVVVDFKPIVVPEAE